MSDRSGTARAEGEPTADTLAVCQHPHGFNYHVAAGDIVGGRCFEPGCECAPRVYVATDVLLSDRAVEAAGRAYSEFEFDGKLPDDCTWEGLGRGREEGSKVVLEAAIQAVHDA